MTADVDSLDVLGEGGFGEEGPADAAELEAATQPEPGTGPGLARLLVGVILHPAATFEQLAARPGRRWLAPLLALVLLQTAFGLATVFSPQAQAYSVAAAQRAIEQSGNPMVAESMGSVEDFATSPLVLTAGVVGALLAGLLGTLVTALVVAAIFHLLGTIFGGQQSFGQMFTVTLWAAWPLAIGLALRLVALLLGHYDPSPHGLSGLVAPEPGQPPGYLAPLLGHLDVWNLWTLALFVPAVSAAAQVPRRKALVALAIFLALNLAFGMAGTALGQALSGLGGG
jgi:hypothetical protein